MSNINFEKISDVNFTRDRELTIEGKTIDVSGGAAWAIVSSLSSHNLMVDRIEYLESLVTQLSEKGGADTRVTKLVYRAGNGYSGSKFSVISGWGQVPEFFKAVSEAGVTIYAAKSLEIRGDGCGALWPVEHYEVEVLEGCAGDMDGQLFTITDVLSGPESAIDRLRRSVAQ